MKNNKNHWYDGRFYDKLIAPNQDSAFKIVKEIIEKDSKILDFGCGTGRLGLQLSEHCQLVDGVDLSYRNINVAKRNLSNTGIKNVRYFHSDISSFFREESREYDYTVLSYVIHEIDEHSRTDILNKISERSRNILIVDYLVPRKSGAVNILNELVEFFAGIEHYRNFNSFVKNGGIKGIAEICGMEIKKEVMNNPVTAHIAVLGKK